MNSDDVSLLADERLPEAVRVAMVSEMLSRDERARTNNIESQRISLEQHKQRWNTPLIAALAGLITLTATFVFDRLTSQGETKNTLTLEQFRQELDTSTAKLKQKLEESSSRTSAEIAALAREREFQYKIVEAELANPEKSNAERAAVLLFLTRAGVLSALDEEQLRLMAEEQKANPDAEIIPRLSSGLELSPGTVARVTLESLSGPSRHILVAGGGDDFCWASDELQGGVFTAAFLEGLTGSADASYGDFPADGLITLSELVDFIGLYVHKASLENGVRTPPNPISYTLAPGGGEFFFLTENAAATVRPLENWMISDWLTWGEREPDQAIVIANSEFEDFPNIPTQDGSRVSAALEELGFDVFAFSNENLETVSRFVNEEFPDKASKNGRIIIYLAGSYDVKRDENGTEAFLAFPESKQGDFSTQLGLGELAEWAAELKETRQVLFVVDSCVGGVPGEQNSNNK